MNRDKVQNLISRFKSQGKMRFNAEASLEQIKDFERENAISLPQKLKEWLSVSDGGDFFLPGGFQLYGVAHQPMIDIEDTDKPNNDYVIIGVLASGDPVLCETNGEKISIYNHEAGRIEADESYSDFDSFLFDLSSILGIEG